MSEEHDDLDEIERPSEESNPPADQRAGGGIAVRVVSPGEEEESDRDVEVPASLPILPLKNTVLFPYLLSPLLVNTPASKRLIDDVLMRPDRMLVCTAV